jgi:hypothetical protein
MENFGKTAAVVPPFWRRNCLCLQTIMMAIFWDVMREHYTPDIFMSLYRLAQEPDTSSR